MSGVCQAGFFCPAGSEVSNPQPCSAGHFCPEGTSSEVPCPVGTFSNDTGNVEAGDCTLCTGYVLICFETFIEEVCVKIKQ